MQILDAAIIVNKVVDDVTSQRRQAFAFKLEFEKAYDRVNRGYFG